MEFCSLIIAWRCCGRRYLNLFHSRRKIRYYMRALVCNISESVSASLPQVFPTRSISLIAVRYIADDEKGIPNFLVESECRKWVHQWRWCCGRRLNLFHSRRKIRYYMRALVCNISESVSASLPGLSNPLDFVNWSALHHRRRERDSQLLGWKSVQQLIVNIIYI